jgi:uncharacterized circularly permuted ATP-grasp superfamily protein
MFEVTGRPRPHCRPLFEDLRVASHTELGQRQKEADKAFLTQGITFTVYGDHEGTERIFPFDLGPFHAIAWGRGTKDQRPGTTKDKGRTKDEGPSTKD